MSETGEGGYVVFRVREERCAFPVEVVDEVVESPVLITLPAMPSHLLGLLRHRGGLVPMLELGGALGLGGEGSAAAALLLRRGGARFALAVDGLLGVRHPPQEHAGHWLDDEGVITILEVDQLFSARALPEGAREEVHMPDDAAGTLSFVGLSLGRERFAIEVEAVREVRRYEEPEPLAGVHDSIEGVVESDGRKVPVLDLRSCLGLPAAERRPDARIVVVGEGEHSIGLVVDSVQDVLAVPAGSVLAAPEYLRGLVGPVFGGVVDMEGGEVLMVLRPERLLTEDQKRVLHGS